MYLTNVKHLVTKENQRGYAGLTACVFAFLIALLLVPGLAFADVRNSDVVMGQTVESRGLSQSQCPNITAGYAYVVSDDGTVYFSRDAQAEVKIASVTKVMTALVALEYGDPESTTITVSQEAATIGESSASLKVGDSMPLKTALRCMMINSGNDAAEAIAESMGNQVRDQLLANASAEEKDKIPESGYQAFIYAMNKKAADLGMTHSVFVNPHGLDMEQYEGDMHSSAEDVAIMCQEAMKNELFRSIVKTRSETVQVTRDGASADVELETTDLWLGSYEGSCGIKTGYTSQAGACFAGAVERDGHILYTVVLNSKDEPTRFVDTSALADWVYGNTIDYKLAHSEETISCALDGENATEVPVVAYVSHKGWIDKTFKATLADPEATVEIFALNGNISQEVSYDDVNGNVSVGQKVGTITFRQHNEDIATADIVAAEACEGPNLIDGFFIWWDRLFRSFGGEQTEADSVLINTTPLVGAQQAA